MSFIFSKDKKNISDYTFSQEIYDALKQVDVPLKEAIEGLNVFHYTLGDVMKKLRELDPGIRDRNLR
jgi:hypothetical protein